MKVTVKDNTLIIEIPFDAKGHPSRSGLTMLHASTGGNQPTAIEVRGKNLVVGVNAYTPK